MADTGLPQSRLGELVRGDAHWIVLLRFLAVGGVSALAMLILALVFASGIGLAPHVAQGLAHALCILPTFLAQRSITFRSNISRRRGLLGYVAMQLPLLALGAGAAWLTIDQLHWPHVIALTLAAALVALTSFVVQRSVIFAAK